MATKLTHLQTFPATSDQVWAMMTDTDYIVEKGMRSGSIEVSAEVADHGEETLIISRRRLPAKLPGFLKRFVGEELVLNETQKWGPADGSGDRRGSFVIDFGGQPMSFLGSLAMTADGDSTTVTTNATIKATVPLVGGKAEKVAVEWTARYLAKEEEVATEWLAR